MKAINSLEGITWGGAIPKIRGLGQGGMYSSSALNFGIVVHPWALPIVKHEMNIVMNLNIH